MKLAFVSTWPRTACGIATYTEHVVRALHSVDGGPLAVLSEEGGAMALDGVEVREVFSRKRPFAVPLVQAAADVGADVVHVQHAPDILGMGSELIALLEGLGARGIRTVVTLHTVYDAWSGLIERKPHVRAFHRRLGAAADRILVHQPTCRDTLVAHGVPADRVALVPHGTDRLAGDGARIRARHDIPPQAPLLLFFGFVHVQKNVHTLLKALPSILARVPEARLLVAGSIAGGTWYNRAYAWYLDRLVRAHGLAGRVTLTRRFVDAADVADTYAAADVVLLPHQQGYGSASGVLHQAIGAGKPLLCSDVPKFEELKDAVGRELLVPATDARAWAERSVRLLTDAAWRQPLLDRLQAYADGTRWEAIAAQHLAAYAAAGTR